MMKMNELPSSSKGQSVELDAKGRNVLLECYADGDIFFWTDDGICLEFDRKNTSLLISALRQQEKLPKTARPTAQIAVASPHPSRSLAAASHRAGPDSAKQKEPNRAVAKEGPGWGATVVANGKTVRYYYDKRDNARDASPSHRIGEAGRIS